MSNDRELFQSVKTLLDLRIARNIPGVPDGQVKIVRGTHEDGSIDFAVFVQNRYLGSLPDVKDEKEAVFVGLAKMNELLHLLTEEKGEEKDV